jgi:hypothetical protein
MPKVGRARSMRSEPDSMVGRGRTGRGRPGLRAIGAGAAGEDHAPKWMIANSVDAVDGGFGCPLISYPRTRSSSLLASVRSVWSQTSKPHHVA